MDISKFTKLREESNCLLPGECCREQNQITGLKEIHRQGFNNYSKNAKVIRDTFQAYFANEGIVNCQWDIVNKTLNFLK